MDNKKYKFLWVRMHKKVERRSYIYIIKSPW